MILFANYHKNPVYLYRLEKIVNISLCPQIAFIFNETNGRDRLILAIKQEEITFCAFYRQFYPILTDFGRFTCQRIDLKQIDDNNDA